VKWKVKDWKKIKTSPSVHKTLNNYTLDLSTWYSFRIRLWQDITKAGWPKIRHHEL